MKTLLLSILAISVATTTYGQSRKERKEMEASRDRFMFAVKPAPEHFREQLPFDNSQDLIIVPVMIKGVVYRFVFDTGAITVISKRLQEKLELKPVREMGLTDASGSTAQQGFYQLDSLQIGSVTFRNVGVSAVPLEAFSNFSCTEIDGFIGTNMMQSCFWKIDMANKVLSFADQPYPAAAGALTLPFRETFSGTPEIDMTLGQTRFKAIWDSGNNTTLALPDSLYFKSSASKGRRLATGSGSIVQTAYGREPYRMHQATLDSLYMDRYLMTEESVTIQPAPAPMIGTRFMQRFGAFYLDYKRKTITLEHAPQNTDKSVNETFGFTPGLEGNSLKVIFVWEGSGAAQQGIKAGDTIVSLAGYNTEALTNETWCGIRKAIRDLNSDARIKVSVKTNDGLKGYEIAKEAIVKD